MEIIGLTAIAIFGSSLIIPFIASHLYIGSKLKQKQAGKIFTGISVLLLVIYMGGIGLFTFGIMMLIFDAIGPTI
jgi:hypothetical protein